MRAIVIGAFCLAAGFAGGILVGRGGGGASEGSVEDARAALAELVSYRGQGASAVRRSIEWVDRVVAGGEAMIPALDEAIRTSPPVKYTSLGGAYSFDPRSGVASLLPTLRSALLEAVSRIGGDEAVPILTREARGAREWTERVLAILFLSTREEPEVRAFLTGEVRKYLDNKRDDPEMTMVLRVTRGRLDPGLAEDLTRALRAGWSRRGAAYEMAETLVEMDPDRAGKLFFSMLGDDQPDVNAKVVAAHALGRLPAFREAAAAELLRLGNTTLLASWLDGLKQRRYGEVDLERDARESGDPARMKAYVEESIEELRLSERLIREIGAKLGAERAAALDLERRLAEFQQAVAAAEETLRTLK